MEGSDVDLQISYYMFVNHGWNPRKYLNLDSREKLLLASFIKKEIESRKNLNKS